MSAAVLSFSKKPAKKEPEKDPHGTGEAFCLMCNHTWVAVAPVGLLAFECPSCHATTGHWKYEFRPSDDTLVRTCDCMNQLFYLTPEGHLCARCGVYQQY